MVAVLADDTWHKALWEEGVPLLPDEGLPDLTLSCFVNLEQETLPWR